MGFGCQKVCVITFILHKNMLRYIRMQRRAGIAMITSTSNQQMKNLMLLMKKAKARSEQGLFVVEGRKMFSEAPEEWIEKVYVSETYYKENEESLNGKSYEVLSDTVFKAVSDTQTPQGILCLVKKPEYKLEELLQEEKTHLLILESVQDPGNLGTMMRTGEGAGISGIIMSQTTVDLFNPKTIRSTMGSIYRVPFYIAGNLSETIQKLKEQNIKVYAAHLKGKMQYDEPDYRGGVAFMIGNEGNGLTDETAGLADTYIRIPMEGKVESLNAAISASLLMYETNRQRRK